MHKVPEKIVELIVKLKFNYSNKAQAYLKNSRFLDEDLINVARSGYVQKKERDEKKEGRYKYTIAGPSCDGVPMYLTGKIVFGKFFVITFHERK